MPFSQLTSQRTMSDCRDQLARKLFKSTIQPIYSLHNFLPLLGIILLSLDHESPKNFLASPLEPKNTSHSYLPCSLPLYQTSKLLFHCIYCVFCIFFYNSVQPLATTVNKQYIVFTDSGLLSGVIYLFLFIYLFIYFLLVSIM